MKCLFVALLIIFGPIVISAQEHRAYADVGYVPGFSATYNYSLAKYVGLGVGVQGYRLSPGMSSFSRLVPAIFADIRFNIRPEKKGQAFAFMDFGMNFYKHSNKFYYTKSGILRDKNDNSFYAGFGLGYLRSITERGGGPYLSVKIVTDWFSTDVLNPVTLLPESALYHIYGDLVFSLGFKF
ncbi:MAG: hypothetical protein JST82_13105 [Bacteroidetes bacterium]|nr:hypothetical protein [Bacteroidota bacterium]